MRYVKTDDDSFIRDISTTAVLNNNTEALSAYKKERERRMKLENVAEEVESLKSDLSQIKDLLNLLVSRS